MLTASPPVAPQRLRRASLACSPHASHPRRSATSPPDHRLHSSLSTFARAFLDPHSFPTPPDGDAGSAALGDPPPLDVLAHSQQLPVPLHGRSRSHLLGLVTIAAHCWFEGIQKGVPAVYPTLASILAPDVAVRADGGALRRATGPPRRGLAALAASLEREHLEYCQLSYQLIAMAACEASGAAFALVETRLQDVGALDSAHPATYRISKSHMIFQVQANSASGLVESLSLRRQLTEEEKDELLADPVHVYPAPFPRTHLAEQGAFEAVEEDMQKLLTDFCAACNALAAAADAAADAAAASSAAAAAAAGGADELDSEKPSATNASTAQGSGASTPAAAPDAGAQQRAAAAALEALLNPDFRLHDAYGIWRHVAVTPRPSSVPTGALLDLLAAAARDHRLACHVASSAVVEGRNVAFFAGRADVKPRRRGRGSATMEVVGVAIFDHRRGDAQLQLRDIWLFREPFDAAEAREVLKPLAAPPPAPHSSEAVVAEAVALLGGHLKRSLAARAAQVQAAGLEAVQAAGQSVHHLPSLESLPPQLGASLERVRHVLRHAHGSGGKEGEPPAGEEK